MGIEVRQLVVKGTLVQRAEDEGCVVDDQGLGGERRAVPVEEILRECRRMIDEALRDQEER